MTAYRTYEDFYAYQKRGVTHLYENTAVQAVMPMGSGKTVVALTAAMELIFDGVIRAGIVLAPKRVAQLVWPKEQEEWLHIRRLKVKLVSGGPKEREAALLADDAHLYVVGIDNTQWLVDVLLKLPPTHRLFGLLCIDELSRLRNPKSARAKALLKVADRFNTIWGLTGTPRPNGYEDQFKPLSILTRNKLWGKSFYKWRDQRFMPLDYNGYKWSIRPEWRDRTVKEIASISFTVSPDELPELPELTQVFHMIDLPPNVRRIYKDMERTLIAKAKAEGRPIWAANQAVATGKLAQIVQGFLYEEEKTQKRRETQFIHSLKGDVLVDLVEDLAGYPTLIAYEFQEDLEVLRELYPGIPHIGAGTTDKQAAEYERRWNRKELPLLALHPASAGHGLNLQHGGNQFIWYGLTWSAELFDQTRKRYWRTGQTQRCFEHFILARDTVDMIKRDRVVEKMTMQEAFTRNLPEI